MWGSWSAYVIETILGFPTMQPRLHGFAALRAIGRLDIRKIEHSVSPFSGAALHIWRAVECTLLS